MRYLYNKLLYLRRILYPSRADGYYIVWRARWYADSRVARVMELEETGLKTKVFFTIFV